MFACLHIGNSHPHLENLSCSPPSNVLQAFLLFQRWPLAPQLNAPWLDGIPSAAQVPRSGIPSLRMLSASLSFWPPGITSFLSFLSTSQKVHCTAKALVNAFPLIPSPLESFNPETGHSIHPVHADKRCPILENPMCPRLAHISLNRSCPCTCPNYYTIHINLPITQKLMWHCKSQKALITREAAGREKQ